LFHGKLALTGKRVLLGLQQLLTGSLQKQVFYHVQCIPFPYSNRFCIHRKQGRLSRTFIYKEIYIKNDNLWLICIANMSYFAIIRNVRYFLFLLFLWRLGCENATKIPQFQKNENSLSLLSCSKASDMSEYGKRMIRRFEEM
jgi:hypothetical protein